MNGIFQDLRYAVRQLRKSLGFSAVAVITLALGIGANTAIFTVVNGLLLKMLPVRDPQQLVVVGDPTHAQQRSNGTPRTDVVSYPRACARLPATITLKWMPARANCRTKKLPDAW